MADPAFTLAALRAAGSLNVSESERSHADPVAAEIGRRITELNATSGSRIITLGFAEGFEPNPDEDVFSVRRLSPVPLVALATCLGLCWADLDRRPDPGQEVKVERVLEVATALGAPRPHLLGAIRNELTMAGLLELDGSAIRLGYAIAAWTDAQVDALRRLGPSPIGPQPPAPHALA